MKKLFVVLFLLLSVSAFSEKFNGVFGFNFGMTQEQCEKVSDDYKINKYSSNGIDYINISFSKKVTYGSNEVESIILSFKLNQLYSIIFRFKDDCENWKDLEKAFETKYRESYNITVDASIYYFNIYDFMLLQSLNKQIERNKLKPIIDDI